MFSFRKSIYWKLLFSFLLSIALSSMVIFLMFSSYGPHTEIHPAIKKSLIIETESLARQLRERLANSSEPLADIVRNLYEQEGISVRVFDAKGNELAAATAEKLQEVQTISPSLLDAVRRGSEYFESIYQDWRWVYSVSLPVTIGGKAAVLQCYYPRTKEDRIIMPRGLVTALVLIALFTAIITRFLTRPIRELTRAAQELSRGRFGVTVRVRSRDEISQLRRTFNEMSQRLAAFHQSRKELFADISHEIRSPLARIQSDAELLIDREMPKEEREEHLKAICEEVEGISRLVEDLSIMSQIENNQLTLEASPSSLQKLLIREAGKFRPQFGGKSVTLRQIMPEDIPPVMMDDKRIGQVISNLLTNALRYTPAGGTIELGVRVNGNMATVWVRDTGPGIPPEALPRIFDRFYRVDPSRSRTSGGTGLGLAIAKHFVEAHGGTIRAESEQTKGTCIQFTLPLAGQPARV
jgi:histidine kinase